MKKYLSLRIVVGTITFVLMVFDGPLVKTARWGTKLTVG